MKILVPIDGSQLSLEAVRHALRLVKEGLRADLVLANVQAPPSLYEIVVARDPLLIHDASAGAGAHLLEEAQALCRAGGVSFEWEVVSGDPVQALCDLAEEYACAAAGVGVACACSRGAGPRDHRQAAGHGQPRRRPRRAGFPGRGRPGCLALRQGPRRV